MFSKAKVLFFFALFICLSVTLVVTVTGITGESDRHWLIGGESVRFEPDEIKAYGTENQTPQKSTTDNAPSELELTDEKKTVIWCVVIAVLTASVALIGVGWIASFSKKENNEKS